MLATIPTVLQTRPWPAILPVVLLLASTSCSSPKVEAGPDATEVTPPDAAEVDVPQSPDVPVEPDVPVLPPPGAFLPFGQAPDDGTPTVFLRSTSGNGPGMVRVEAVGRNLGKVAGVAFYLEFDPTSLSPSMTETNLIMSDANPYFTVSRVEEIRPGIISFGAARFCKDKMPWAGVDQCGGRDINEDTVLMEAAFNLLVPGESALRIPTARIVIRRPDRTRVEPIPVGGTVRWGGAR